jgi:RyR domain-containing protein
MPRSATTMKIAKLAHECWCRAMLEEGWQFGARFDEEAGTHNALCPFEELSPLERDQIAIGIENEELENTMTRCVDLCIQRGPAREFAAEEMRVGLRVRTTGEPADYGHVVSWEVEDAELGRLGNIRIQWDDGTVQEHHAAVRELARVDET